MLLICPSIIETNEEGGLEVTRGFPPSDAPTTPPPAQGLSLRDPVVDVQRLLAAHLSSENRGNEHSSGGPGHDVRR